MDTTEAATFPAAPGSTSQVRLSSQDTCLIGHVSADNVLPTRSKGSLDRKCPSHQMSDTFSENTHSSMEQPITDHCYASLIPWTSKLTAPGYVPLAEPAADAMPISFDVSEDTASSLTVPSSNYSTQFWTLGPHQTFSHPHRPITLTTNSCEICSLKRPSTLAPKSEYKMQSNKENRLRRTVEALQSSGLWEVALKTGSLLQRNRELQKEVQDFRPDAIVFLNSLIKKPFESRVY